MNYTKIIIIFVIASCLGIAIYMYMKKDLPKTDGPFMDLEEYPTENKDDSSNDSTVGYLPTIVEVAGDEDGVDVL